VTISWFNSFQLVLFDFDGLLVNTENLHFGAYVAMCKKRGFDLSWDFDRFLQAAHFESTGLRDAIYAEFPVLYSQEPRWEVLYAEKKQAYMNLLASGQLKLMPGVERMLQALENSKTKCCVVTNSPAEQVAFIKCALPALNSIPHWITREHYLKAKPDPESYLTAITKFADPNDRIIGFEDSFRGLKALLGAGAKGVMICHSSHPQFRMFSLNDVPHFQSFEHIPDHAIL
jgi:beta-phosphoglucomutase